MIGIIVGLMIVGGLALLIIGGVLSDSYALTGNVIAIIGLIILIIAGGIVMSTSQCQTECKDIGLVFSHQEYNQCSEELTCYCKQPITQPKPKVVIIE